MHQTGNVHWLIRYYRRLVLIYRPVSNLQYVSKLTERAVFNQLHEHMMANGIYPLFQSAYRQYHGTETALLRVMNDILLKMNSQHVTLLVLLDLSAAFDTVSHDVLLDRLHNDVGLRGNALNWFYFYLSQRSQRVSIHGTLSNYCDLDCGVFTRLLPWTFIICSLRV